MPWDSAPQRGIWDPIQSLTSEQRDQALKEMRAAGTLSGRVGVGCTAQVREYLPPEGIRDGWEAMDMPMTPIRTPGWTRATSMPPVGSGKWETWDWCVSWPERDGRRSMLGGVGAH